MTTRFLQLHFLTTYAANNLNRDDLGRPKSLTFGTAPRLRLSSQAIKRAWRISDVLQDAMAEAKGTRSRDVWFQLGQALVAAGHSEATVLKHVTPIRIAFEGTKKKGEDAGEDAAETSAPATDAPATGKKQTKKGLDLLKGDLYFFSQSELDFINTTVEASLAAGKPAEEAELKTRIATLLMSGDVAMFGRMVASEGALTVEGAVQVAHPFTVNRVNIDDDFFTAVDDLNSSGSGHMGSNAFGAGLYYGYINVDLPLLVKNLGGDSEMAQRLLVALAQAVATVAPGGKQNTFAARAYATYMMAELGNAQPRSFADAYLTPVRQEPLAETAVQALVSARDGLIKAFPGQQTRAATINRLSQEGSFADIEALIADAFA